MQDGCIPDSDRVPFDIEPIIGSFTESRDLQQNVAARQNCLLYREALLIWHPIDEAFMVMTVILS